MYFCDCKLADMKTFINARYIILLLLAANFVMAQERPKIGLTLSGGGAKGIAHIGLLKAIDSAGIKVDYVTGTSMGAVVGGLYAAGYSGDSIMKLAQKLDWATMLSNDPPPKSFNLREQEEIGKYIELPLMRGKLALKRGFLESNELWMALAEMYYPYYTITDFNDFEKGFRCIATDVATGEMVVLKSGNITNAIRASMAIPSIFTPVEIDGKVLIDGGLVRNFPVTDVREMGATIVIGSDVSGKQDPIEQAHSPLDIISRLPFYSAIADHEIQKKQVDIYVDYPLGKISTASFGSAEEIIKIGMQKGRELYPALKRMKDSLDLIYGPKIIVKEFSKSDKIEIVDYEVRGIPKDEAPLFMDILELPTGKAYAAKDLSAAMRRATAARLYSKITYLLEPSAPGRAKIIFTVEKLPPTYAQFGVHYNTTTGIALKTGIVKRGIINPFSAASLMFSIGENPRGEAVIGYYTGKRRKLLVQAKANFEIIDIKTYDTDFVESGLYNQTSQNCDLLMLWQPQNNWSAGVGTTISSVVFDPKITSALQVEGSAVYLNSYLVFQSNTLNQALYPNNGHRLFVKGGIIYNQIVNFTIYQDKEVLATQDLGLFSFKPYTQLKITFEQYFPVDDNAFLVQVQSGMNFNYKQSLMNDFVIGGLNNVIRNQVTFAGLPDAAIFTSSVVSAQAGYQHQIIKNLFITGKVNALWFDFVKSNYRLNTVRRQGFGGSLTAGYKTPLGPVEASLMYSDLGKQVLPYFNIGYILSI